MKEDKWLVESKICGFADNNTSKDSTSQETSASKSTLYIDRKKHQIWKRVNVNKLRKEYKQQVLLLLGIREKLQK